MVISKMKEENGGREGVCRMRVTGRQEALVVRMRRRWRGAWNFYSMRKIEFWRSSVARVAHSLYSAHPLILASPPL